MEIKRQIVESYLPPENKNVWWFDSNQEILKRFVGTNWIPVTAEANVSYLPIEPTETINTTYAEAKALYEAGEMKPGVYYRFTYYHKKSMHIYDGDTNGSHTVYNELDIDVYLDKHGDLKAKGYYEYNDSNPPEYKTFISDYTFDIVATDVPSYGESEYRIFKKGVYANIYDNYLSSLESILRENNISYTISDTGDGFFDINFETPCIDYYISMDSEEKIYLFNNGFHIGIDSGSDYFPSDYISFKETGLLYNIDYGEYKHSYLFDGYNDDGSFIALIGNIDNKLDNHIIVNYSKSTLASFYADLKNCDVLITNIYDGPHKIYAINTFINIYDLDSNIIIGDEYYGEEYYDGEDT